MKKILLVSFLSISTYCFAQNSDFSELNEKDIAANSTGELTSTQPLKTNTAEREELLFQKYGMIKVPGGSFVMGDNEGNRDEKPEHTVKVDTFYMARYECTQKIWQEVMQSNPSKSIGDNKPVEKVTWNDAQEFIRKLNEITGMNFRLPTEAEWEFAARGGNHSNNYTYSGHNVLDNVGWYWQNSGTKSLSGTWDAKKISESNCQTNPVGQKSPNELGLYDMSGNVWEWCSDWYSDYYYLRSEKNNPKGPEMGEYKVKRSGSWYYLDNYCKVTFRSYFKPDKTNIFIGFRLAHDAN